MVQWFKKDPAALQAAMKEVVLSGLSYPSERMPQESCRGSSIDSPPAAVIMAIASKR
jgi:hypothetical protein